MQYKTNNMRLHLIHMHRELTVIAIQSKSVRPIGCQLHPGPFLGVISEFVQDPGGQIRSIHKERLFRSIDDFRTDFCPRRGQSIPDPPLQGGQQILRTPRQAKAVLRKVGYQECGVHRLDEAFVSLATFFELFDLLEAFFHECLPSWCVGYVVGDRIRVVAFVVLLDAFGFDESDVLFIGITQIPMFLR